MIISCYRTNDSTKSRFWFIGVRRNDLHLVACTQHEVKKKVTFLIHVRYILLLLSRIESLTLHFSSQNCILSRAEKCQNWGPPVFCKERKYLALFEKAWLVTTTRYLICSKVQDVFHFDSIHMNGARYDSEDDPTPALIFLRAPKMLLSWRSQSGGKKRIVQVIGMSSASYKWGGDQRIHAVALITQLEMKHSLSSQRYG